MADKTPELGVPQRIGRYAIQRVIGRGMMGIVYQAQDTLLRRTVALKTISLALAVSDADRQSFERRFLDEARAAAALSHPAIVVVYDLGSDPQSRIVYMALEYLRGKTLEAVLAEGVPLDWRQSLVTVSRLADALHHAHRNRVIHRDIKPANVMVLGSGEPKLMDFGVAKLEASQLTMGGQVFGSPSYMSPEQAGGDRVDERTDIFSLGSVAYELLTGRRAFPGKDVSSIVTRLLSEEPLPPSRLVAGLPMAVDAVLAKALAKPREKRYANAKAFAEDLEDVLAGRAPRHAGPVEPATMVASGGRGTVPSKAPLVGDSTILAGAPASPALPATTRVSLAVLDGPQRGTALAFERARISIGRSGGGADVELADGEVSRTHAVLECYGRRVVLRDLGSTNGTFVGERRIEEAALESRSEFRVGRTRLMLILADEG